MLNALGRIFGRRASEDRNDPMAFLDEYAAVMNRHGLRCVTVSNGGVPVFQLMLGSTD